MSKVLGFELPWWVWALMTWGACLLFCIVLAFVAPSDLWTVPILDDDNVGELTNSATCNDCTLFKDQLYLTFLRKDQCEAPNFTKTVNCDILAETGFHPDPNNPKQCTPAKPVAAPCGTATIVEPENTWSNFGYLLAGILILFRRPRLLGLAVGINFCVMFLFSGLYHASLQKLWQALDVAWIYVLLLSIIAYAVQALGLRYKKEFMPKVVSILSVSLPAGIGILVAALKATDNLPSSPFTDSTNLTIALVVILGIPVVIILLDFWWVRWDTETFKKYYDNLAGREYIWGEQWKFQLWMFIPALLGGMFRTALFGLPGDGCGHSMCQPHSAFQAHAAWHILGAFALWWTYDFLAQATASQDTMVKIGIYAR